MKSLRVETVSLSEIETKHLIVDRSPLRPVVLVVDDENMIADTIVAILDKAGYAAMAAYNGESALGMALTVPPDILVADVDLGQGINGIEVAVALRTHVPDCRTLIFSGRVSSADLLADAEVHGHKFPFLQKPVHPRDLLAQINLLRFAASVNLSAS
jgi:DNA-binding response OmpR family regulator